MSAPAFLQIRHIVKNFDGHPAVDDVCIDIAKGEVFALLGSPGCDNTAAHACGLRDANLGNDHARWP